MIIDGQVHLWEANSAARPWAPGAIPDLPEPLTAERFIAIMDSAGVDRAVIAPPGVSGFDPSYALECAAKYPNRFAVTSRWTLDDPDGSARLPTWLQQKGMIGIRLAITDAVRQRWIESGQLAQFWSDAERYEIPLMLFSPGRLVEIEAAAKVHPKLKLVVDHANLVGSQPDTVNAMVDDLISLARYDNVGVKMGALPLRSVGRYPFTDLHEPLRRIYNAFGARRLIWASDHTTSAARNKATYQENLDLIRKAAFGSIPASDMDWILGRTLSTWFRWA